MGAGKYSIMVEEGVPLNLIVQWLDYNGMPISLTYANPADPPSPANLQMTLELVVHTDYLYTATQGSDPPFLKVLSPNGSTPSWPVGAKAAITVAANWLSFNIDIAQSAFVGQAGTQFVYQVNAYTTDALGAAVLAARLLDGTLSVSPMIRQG